MRRKLRNTFFHSETAHANSHATSCIDKSRWSLPQLLPGFRDLDDPNFSFDGSFSLLIFYVKRKNEQNLSIRSLNFLQNVSSKYVLFSFHLSVRQFQMPHVELSFVKTLVTFEITRLTYTNTKIVFLRSCRPCWIVTCANFSKLRSFSTRFISATKSVISNFFCISDTSY